MIREVRRRLEKNGYTVISAASGEDGIKKAVEEKPDLILLDVVMSGRSGFGICKLLKENVETKDIPVIMVTSLFGKSAVEKGVESGAAYLISKPFDPADLIWQIEDVLKNKRTQK
jgi:DNA-binding response OmpR family regulator